MEDQKPYLVEFAAASGDEDRVRAALEAAGITVVRGTGARTVPLGGDLPTSGHYHATAYAPGEGEAAGKVADALKETGIDFTPIRVTPV